MGSLVQDFQVISLVIGELLTDRALPRRPEPQLMSASADIEAFHGQGEVAGALLPVYHFNALAISRMLPAGGRLLDLGCGSGQFLRYLAQCRPDVALVGIDLSPSAIERGRNALRREKLDRRVTLRVGDMTDLSSLGDEHFDTVSCVYSLHHLPNGPRLRRCLREVAALRRRCNCAVWIFDHARPRSRRTALRFPKILTPSAPQEFQRESTDSLMASFTFRELSSQIAAALPDSAQALARLLPVFQACWTRTPVVRPHAECWNTTTLAGETRRAFRRLCAILPGVPLEIC